MLRRKNARYRLTNVETGEHEYIPSATLDHIAYKAACKIIGNAPSGVWRLEHYDRGVVLVIHRGQNTNEERKTALEKGWQL